MAEADIKHRYTGKGYLEVAADERVKYKDFFDIKMVYLMLHEWLVEEGWATRKDSDFPEDMYLHRFTQEAGQEVWIWWRLKKKLTSYYQWEMDMDWHILGLKETEVMHNGVKYKAHWGEVEFKVYAKQIADPEGTWKSHWFLKHVQDLFWKRIYKVEFESHKRELLREVQRFLEAIKTYMKLRTYLPEPEWQKFHTTREFE